MGHVYRFIKDIYDGREAFVVSGDASSISQGDMCQWDPTSRYATNNLLGSGSIFLGISEDAFPLRGLGSSTNPLVPGNRIRIKSNGVHFMKTTNGETYSHGEALYQGADQQTVTKVSAGRPVARVWLPNGTQVVGTGSNTVHCIIFGSMTNNSMIPSAADAAK